MGIIRPRPSMRGRERREIEARLRLHAEFMGRLRVKGWTREAASAEAYRMVREGGEWQEPAPRDGCLDAAGGFRPNEGFALSFQQGLR